MAEDPHKSLTWTEEDPEQKQLTEKGKNYLLLIGIDKYKHVAKLQNAV